MDRHRFLVTSLAGVVAEPLAADVPIWCVECGQETHPV